MSISISEQQRYLLALTFLPGVGNITAKNLISYCGSAENVFTAKNDTLCKTPGIGHKLAMAIIKSKDAALKKVDETLDKIERKNIQLLFYNDPQYPVRLRHFSDSPIIFYCLGNPNLNPERALAIVGTRNITDYGRDRCEQTISELAPYKPMIVSGLAYGVDAKIHQLCLQYNLPTIAVLGNGLSDIYPAAHKGLAAQMIAEKGGILSEFPLDTRPDATNFPQRNRIVAGMTDGCLIIETADKGGSMITAKHATTYNRDVFAYPGRVNDRYSSGCNTLIKQQSAQLITSGTDIVDQLRWHKTNTLLPQPTLFVDLSPEEHLLIEKLRLSDEPVHIDLLFNTLKVSSSEVAALLLSLEFKGLVKAMPGNRFRLLQ